MKVYHFITYSYPPWLTAHITLYFTAYYTLLPNEIFLKNVKNFFTVNNLLSVRRGKV